MSWKTEIQLGDLDAKQRLELTCQCCHVVFFRVVSEVMQQEGLKYAYIDEVEAALRCQQRGCNGGIRLALEVDGETEGFSGGLA